MKTIRTAVLVIAATLLSWSGVLQAQSTEGPSPVEAFFCDMQPGKDMGDLMEVSKRFAKWADKNFEDYSAWILTPRFAQFTERPQVIWLGSSQAGDQMGKGLDAWLASGQDIQAEFDKVIDCAGHAVASSTEIHAPDGPPENGVVMFTECSLAEGSDWGRAVTAHGEYSAGMRSLGARMSNWLFFPMLGSADNDFDYWGVSTFANWTDFFAAYELYVNGGGWQKGTEAFEGATSCGPGTSTVWDVRLVRMAES